MVNGNIENIDNTFLIDKLKESEYSDDEIKIIIDGLSEKKITTFRINRVKLKDKKTLIDSLDRLGIKYSFNKDFKDAFILDDYYQKDGFDSKTSLKLDTSYFFKEGLIYVQSLSSMIPVYIIDPHEKENILDMCAAPGSKTTMIQSLCNNKVNLTAVELHKDRFEKLEYNCKLQSTNAFLINRSVIDLDDMLKFDKILIDAPCSGSGTLDITNNRYKKYFTDDLIKKCVSTQKKLIKKASKLLKKNGTLVYSTCSLLKCENEDMVDYAIDNGFDVEICSFKKESKRYSVGSSINEGLYIKIFPDKLWEGFFVAKLTKR